jgi:hypothetical protein
MQVLQSLLEEADQRQTSSWLPHCLVAANGESREAEFGTEGELSNWSKWIMSHAAGDQARVRRNMVIHLSITVD